MALEQHELRQVNILPFEQQPEVENPLRWEVNFKTCVKRENKDEDPITFAAIIDAIESKLNELYNEVPNHRVHIYYAESYVLPDGNHQCKLHTDLTDKHMYKLHGEIDSVFYEVCTKLNENRLVDSKPEWLMDKGRFQNELLCDVLEPYFSINVPGMC